MNFESLKALLDNPDGFITGPGRDCIVLINGKEVFRHFAGHKDFDTKDPMKGNELYNLYSCTKVSTCAAALTLVDKGLLKLDDPVSKYIPEFADLKLENGEKAKNEMKVIHLFTMSGGMDYDIFCDACKNVYAETDGKCPTITTAKALASRPLHFEPGSAFRYSLCHDILAAVVEVCSGMPYYDYFKSVFMEPLLMKDTTFTLCDDQKLRMPRQYTIKDNKIVPTDNSNCYKLGAEYQSGGAGLISSITDYVKILDMLCHGGVTPDGERILKQETIELMRTPQFNDEWQKTFNNWVGWSKGYKYGLGVYILDKPTDANSIAPKGCFGWDGAAGSFISIDPENKITMFFTQHLLSNEGHRYHEALRNEIYKAINAQ